MDSLGGKTFNEKTVLRHPARSAMETVPASYVELELSHRFSTLKRLDRRCGTHLYMDMQYKLW